MRSVSSRFHQEPPNIVILLLEFAHQAKYQYIAHWQSASTLAYSNRFLAKDVGDSLTKMLRAIGAAAPMRQPLYGETGRKMRLKIQ